MGSAAGSNRMTEGTGKTVSIPVVPIGTSLAIREGSPTGTAIGCTGTVAIPASWRSAGEIGHIQVTPRAERPDSRCHGIGAASRSGIMTAAAVGVGCASVGQHSAGAPRAMQ